LIDRRQIMLDLTNDTTHRRGFLGRLAAGAAAFGLGGLAAPSAAVATPRSATSGAAGNPEFEAWLNKITGKHKMIYDVPEPNDGFAFWWARVFLNTTNETYGTTDADNTVVIVLRHSGIPFAMENTMWLAKDMGMQADAIKKEWVANLLPGVVVVPSGVIAVNRAQEKGCAYCFAG